MTSHRLRRLLAGTALVLATGAAAAGPAHADSIAYVKDGDVWLSTSDGGRQYRVTTTGGYSSVSQSDLGTIVALHGDHIRTIDRETGAVRHDILTPASSSYPGTPFRGPFDPVISPNGTKIAYTWYYTETGSNDNCNPSTGCQTVYGRQGTGFTRPDKITGFDDYGFQSRSGWVGPSWMDDGSVVSSDPIQVGNDQVAFMTPGDESNRLPGATQQWWSNSAVRGLRDVEQSPLKTAFAAIADTEGGELIHLYRPGKDYPLTPTEACFQISTDKGRPQSPSWKPDGTRLAFSDDAGVNTIAMPDFKDACGAPTEKETTLLIPGGRFPDWGPADVPPARVQAPEPTPTQTATPAPTAGPGKQPAVTGSLKAAKVSRKALLRGGLRISVTGATPGRHVLRVTLRGRVVGTGRLLVAADGRGSARVRVARKRLKGKGTLKLVVTGAGLRTTVRVTR